VGLHIAGTATFAGAVAYNSKVTRGKETKNKNGGKRLLAEAALRFLNQASRHEIGRASFT
jgi:hypothetical protein